MMNVLLNALTLILAAAPFSAPMVDNGAAASVPHQIVFEEDLTLGGDVDDDNLLWANVNTTVEVNRGLMYVVDTAGNRILEFDAKGTFLRQIGREGQGPGEYTALTSLQFLAEGGAVVFEVAPGVLPSLTFLDDGLNFVRKEKVTSMQRIPAQIQFSDDMKLLAGSYVSLGSQGEMSAVTGVLDRNYNAKLELTRVNQSLNPAKLAEPGYLSQFIADFVGNSYNSAAYAVFDNQGNLYTAVGKAYEIVRRNGDTLAEDLRFTREQKRRPMSDDTRASLIEQGTDAWRVGPLAAMVNDALVRQVDNKLELQAYENPVNGLLVDHQGRLLVVNKLDRDNGDQTVDVFNSQGQFLGTTTLPDWSFVTNENVARMVFDLQYAYTIQTDSEDNNRLVRYRYKILAK